MDAETIEAVRRAIMWAALAGLAALLITLFAAAVLPELRRAWRRARPANRAAATLFAAGLALYAASKHATGRFTFDSNLVDAGSYLTNDVAHVSIRKRTQMIPDDTEILVYARQVDLTNATDWVRLEPRLTLAQHLLVEGVYSWEYALPNATNHDVMVAANFTPAPTVHTNGVWHMKGFIIPGTGKSAFPNTRIRKE